jgi:hypothetical protein
MGTAISRMCSAREVTFGLEREGRDQRHEQRQDGHGWKTGSSRRANQ